MLCKTWILLLLLTVLFGGQLSSTVPDGTFKKSPEGMSYSEFHQSWWKCWASAAGCPACCWISLKLNSTAFACVHTEAKDCQGLQGWIALLKPLLSFLNDARCEANWVMLMRSLLQVPCAECTEYASASPFRNMVHGAQLNWLRNWESW